MPRDNEQFSSDFPGAVRDCLRGAAAGVDAAGAGAGGAGPMPQPFAMFFQAASGNICILDLGFRFDHSRAIGSAALSNARRVISPLQLVVC